MRSEGLSQGLYIRVNEKIERRLYLVKLRVGENYVTST